MRTILFVFLITAVCSLQAQMRWVKRYDGPVHGLDYAADITIHQNNVYVAGSSWAQNSNSDFMIIKYDITTGMQYWAYRYNAPHSGTDNAMSITTDNTGNIYATGNVNNDNPSGVDMFTVSITSTGGVRWIKEYTGQGDGVDQGIKILTDSYRNVYIVGVTSAPAGDFDIIVLKYSELGNEIWRKQYESPQVQMPKDMYVDKITGEVYITGYTNESSNYLTLKINSDGSIGWTRIHNGTASQEDIAESIGHNIYNGDLYITGKCENTGSGVGITTICYKKNGDQKWISRYNCPVSGGTSAGYDVEFAGDNTIYVSAASNENNMAQTTGLVLGIDTLGNLRWKNTYASRFGNFNSQNIPSDMKINSGGVAYISATGYDSTANTGYNFMLVSVNRYGSINLEQYHSTFSDFTRAIDVSSKGIAITGSSDTTGQSSDMLTAVFRHRYILSNTNRKIIIPNSNESDSMHVYEFGNYGDATNILNLRVTLDTIIFPQDGDLEIFLEHNGITDTLIYHNGGSGDNFIATDLYDSASVHISVGNAPFTGSFKPYRPLSVFNGTDVTGTWILKIKNTGSFQGELRGWSMEFDIDENTIGIQQVSSEIPNEFTLSQNYPNPFNPVTNIKFSIHKASLVTLKIYDILGREIAQPINQNLGLGTYNYDFNASHLPSGVYFYTLSAGEYRKTRKMILVK
jgi:hypothetical protein